MKRNNHFYVRKTHRYLGIVIGIQFLFWTAGGLYFSWSNMEVIHGDPYINQSQSLSINKDWESPTHVIQKIITENGDFETDEIKISTLLKEPVYQIFYTKENKKYIQLAYAETGVLRPPITQDEAEKIALNSFKSEAKIISVELIESKNINLHHEYRGNPLPAYAITFDHPTRSTLYISKDLGTLQKIRIDKWRIFDFLWMLHTMDYNTRDNFGNILLKSFSVLGIVTIISGFTLFMVSSPNFKRRKKELK